MINYDLAKKQGLDQDTQDLIEFYQDYRDFIFNRMADMPEKYAKMHSILWEENEYRLQSLWRFPRDPSYHRFWDLPWCKCPKMDNDDDYPFLQHKVQHCPIHGWNEDRIDIIGQNGNNGEHYNEI